MAGLYDSSAASALNEDEYINKIYDAAKESRNQTLRQGYEDSTQQLTQGQQQTKEQTNDYVKRTLVESKKAAGNMGTTVRNPQAALALNNQQQANVTALNQQQSAADQEFERLRKVLADRYSADIRQAQADNDMERAQALYEAAKAEEAQLRALRQSGATLGASQGDNTLMDQIAAGTPVQRDTTTPTWEGVDRNEENINKIYDAQMESQRIAAEADRDENLSELEAQHREQTRQTDENLTQAYVNALKNNGNYLETQTAYGQGSGTAAQARLARELGLTREMTDLRKLQQGSDAETERQKLALIRAYGDSMAATGADTESKRSQALIDAAEGEEQALVDEQQFLGEQLAKRGDYSVLRKLYGLPEQVQSWGAIPDALKNAYYKGWDNETLEDMANSGIEQFLAKNPTIAAAVQDELKNTGKSPWGTK